MNIQLNGEMKQVQEGLSLSQLLATLDVNPHAVVVERNEIVVRRAELETVQVEEKDKIEIVKFIGGGSDEPELESAHAPEEDTSKPNGKTVKKVAKKATRKKAKKKKTTTRRRGPKNLVIVESPAKAKTINKYLGTTYQVEASMGHVRDLPKSKMGVDFENNFEPQYVIVAKSRKTVTNLKKQSKGKEAIYLAPDPDREGEAITWHLAHILKEVNPEASIQRVVFNEITKGAVQEAFKQPQEINMDLVYSQQARRILDRIVGYELSPLLWKKVGRGLSAGRVQSVALRLIVEREKEIKSFVPQEYWTVEATLSSETEKNKDKTFIAKLEKINGEKAELSKRDQTESVRQEILSQSFVVDKVEKHERKRRPSAPYITSKLQQEAYNRLGFPAAKTMRIAQKLYEGIDVGDEGTVGLITYMRTDSVNLSKTAQEEIAKFVGERHGKEYLPEKPPVYKSKKRAQEAHEAIRATSVYREPKLIQQFLDDDEYKLYDLIWRKTIASQMTPAIDEHMTVLIAVGDKYLFKTTGRRNLFPGFSVLYDGLPLGKKEGGESSADGDKEGNEAADAPKEQIEELPEFIVGEVLKLHQLMGYQHFTKPVGRFNDASLVKVLEEKGIGRPSTYAPTIYTLLVRDYVNRKGGALFPTELGEMVVELLVEHFPKILDVAFTATMEDELDKIEDGDVSWDKVLREFYGPFADHVNVAKEKMKDYRHTATPTDYKCDTCGKQLVIKWGRFGKFLACMGFPDCTFTRSMPTGHICPNEGCGGDLVKRKSAKGRTFYGCSNFPKCNFITNKLPKQEDEVSEDEKVSETEREILGP